MSARTGGYILLQLLFDLSRPGSQADRVLNGPTNDVWIDPWLAHLRSLGVDYRSEHQVQAIHCAGGRISRRRAWSPADNAYEETRRPLRRRAAGRGNAHSLASDELKQAEPRLAGLHRLRTRWMNGIMFYLDRDVPLVARAHRLHRLALGADLDLAGAVLARRRARGDGRRASRRDPLGRCLRLGGAGHRPRQAGDVLLEGGGPRGGLGAARGRAQDAGIDVLDDANVLAWFLDPAIVYPNPTTAMNLEPLLINTAGSWEHRPEAETAIDEPLPGLRLRSTYTDLATMEGANEAARRAVNGILERTGSNQPRCPRVGAHGAGDLRSGARPRPRAFRTSPAGPAAVPGGRRADRGLRGRLGRGLRRRAGLADPGLVALQQPERRYLPVSPCRRAGASKPRAPLAPAAPRPRRRSPGTAGLPPRR